MAKETRPEGEARVVGRFRLDAKLGSGGMGDVFRAYDPVLDRAVALKVLRTEATSDGSQQMRRVIREARAAAALTHPNTVTIFEVGEADNEVFIAMELLEGEDLRGVLERREASLDDKLRWLCQAARALAAAHERGLVHRDVKPENMFVCKDGALKLLDFGIAKRDDDEGIGGAATDLSGPSSLRTQEGRQLGTPRYMAPEQRAGESTDLRTDEYAWGLVAFELLTGSDMVASMATVTREGGATDASNIEVFGAERAAALRAKLPELSESIIVTVARALEPRQEDRFPSMGPIVAAFDAKPDSVPSNPPRSAPRSAEAAIEPPEDALQPSARAQTARDPVERASPSSRGRLRYWLAAGVVTLAATGGVLTAPRITRSGGPMLPLIPKLIAPACRVESTQVVPVGPDDRIAVLPDGAVVVARDMRRGIFLERVTASGAVPILRNPFTAALTGTYQNVVLGGITYDGGPAVKLELDQGGSTGTLLSVWTESGGMTSQRIWGPLTGLTAIAWRDDILALVTTPTVPPRHERGLGNGVEIWRISPRGAARPTSIEDGPTGHPAIAANDDTIAVAYVFVSELHFALLDANLDRIGDVRTVVRADAAPAIALVGTTAHVFWTDTEHGKTRLKTSSYTRGDAAMTAPKVAIEEPLNPTPPVTARLPGGGWAVAWVAATGPATLRVSPVGKGGVLTGPSDIATGRAVGGLKATSTARGVDFLWFASETEAQIARVTCAPP